MISPAQKRLLHIYSSAAGLTRDEYEAVLVESTGRRSCLADGFDNSAVSAALAALETVLWARVSAGLIPKPTSRHIRPPGVFATPSQRQPRLMATDAQLARLRTLLDLAEDYSPSTDYLHGVIAQACGRASPPTSYTRSQASAAISALQAFLARAVPVPF